MAQPAAKSSDNRFGRGRSNRTEKQKANSDKRSKDMKGSLNKGLRDRHAKNHEDGIGNLGHRLHLLTTFSSIMPSVESTNSLSFGERFYKDGYEKLELDPLNTLELRVEEEGECCVYSTWEDLGEQGQLEFTHNSIDLLTKIGLAFLGAPHHGIKWNTRENYSLASLLGYYARPARSGHGRSSGVEKGYTRLFFALSRLGTSKLYSGSLESVQLQMFRGFESIVYHPFLHAGEDAAKMLVGTEETISPPLAKPKGFELKGEGKFSSAIKSKFLIPNKQPLIYPITIL